MFPVPNGGSLGMVGMEWNGMDLKVTPKKGQKVIYNPGTASFPKRNNNLDWQSVLYMCRNYHWIPMSKGFKGPYGPFQ